MLRKILSVSGKPGLYRLLSQSNHAFIVESLTDKKRFPVHATDKVVSLQEIAIYTKEGEMPLGEVLDKVYAHFSGNKVTDPRLTKGGKEELYALMDEVLPAYDRERVYPTDVKKLFQWYNLLVESGFDKFARIEEKDAEQTEPAPGSTDDSASKK